jgi:leucyl-tRNA synthetase
MHGQVPVPDAELPVTLPEDVAWKPSGESPLELHSTWSEASCPICAGSLATRYGNDGHVHLLVLVPPQVSEPRVHGRALRPEEYAYWMPVNAYTGGAEHSTMHLIYTRFFHKALRDLGLTHGPEPMLALRNQRQILGPDGQRMSKSRGNVIEPDEQVRLYGADAVRAYRCSDIAGPKPKKVICVPGRLINTVV